MRTPSLVFTTLCAVALAGCAAADLDRLLQQDATGAAAVESKSDAAKAEAAKADAAKREADAKEAICKWATSAGIDNLAAAKIDTAATKRRIASVIAAHEVTCPKASPPSAAVPAPKKS